MNKLYLYSVIGMLSSGLASAHFEKVAVRGSAKGLCTEEHVAIIDRAHSNGMKEVGFVVSCNDWNDEIEEIGFPNCDYKKAESTRTCIINPF